MALEQLPQLVAAGVSCFKIEGRLKGPEYVAATTAAYRAGVDAAWEQLQQQQQQQQVADAGSNTNATTITSSSRTSSSRTTSSITTSRSSNQSTVSTSSSLVAPEVLSAVMQVFSRAQDEQFGGLTPGFLEGSQHQRLVRGRSPRHRGLCLGRIAGE
jgi:collagenase-like PrtC family protease